jgi:murein DD-endopeptidase MepM/ murein hydrolase activator NlpD
MFYDLPNDPPPDEPVSTRRFPLWVGLVLACAFLVAAGLGLRGCRGKPAPVDPSPAAPAPPEPVEAKPQGLLYGFPTAQRDLHNTNSLDVYQCTASGRVESGWYGSVRTESVGGLILPSFHEGLDIAAMRRDRRGAPLDTVHAVADGRVAYVSRVAGNSNYGIYVVLLHEDPAGLVYTLYAHLAKVEPWVKAGQPVDRGRQIGLMGNTASNGIPMQRAHLHFEVGMMLNARFQDWYRAAKQIPDHGNFHGHNLAGIHPLALYTNGSQEARFNMLEHLRTLPAAFKLVVRHGRAIDYFRRYPGLWQGAVAERPAHVVLAFSEGGVPLSGRAASPAEAERAGRADIAVLEVDESVLGRNGQRLVVKRQGVWQLGGQGERWMQILLY